MQPDATRNKMRRLRFQWRLLPLFVVLGVIVLFLLTQRVTAPPTIDPILMTATSLVEWATAYDAPLMTVTIYPLFSTITTPIDIIWQTATVLYIDGENTVTQEAPTATRTLEPTQTWGFPTIEVGVPVVTLPPGVISTATAANDGRAVHPKRASGLTR